MKEIPSRSASIVIKLMRAGTVYLSESEVFEQTCTYQKQTLSFGSVTIKYFIYNERGGI